MVGPLMSCTYLLKSSSGIFTGWLESLSTKACGPGSDSSSCAIVTKVSHEGILLTIEDRQGRTEDVFCDYKQLGLDYDLWKGLFYKCLNCSYARIMPEAYVSSGDLLDVEVKVDQDAAAFISRATPMRSWEGTGKVLSWDAKNMIGKIEKYHFSSPI